MLLILCLLAVLHGVGAVTAQASGQLNISGLQDGDFPLIRFTMEVIDERGRLVSDLQPAELQIIEDGYSRPVVSLDRVQPGVQFFLAVNESPNLTNQYQGVSYYRLLMQKLEAWAQGLDGTQPDSYSYITNAGVQITQAANPQLFGQALAAYQPDLVAARPGLTSLTLALDLSTDPLPNPHMKRAILYVTPLPDAAAREALPNVTERAVQLGTRVFVWVIAPGIPLESSELAPLRQLAEATGGEVYLYSGAEDFPDPNHYLEPLRYIYQAAFRSGAISSGEHRLVVSITRPGLELSSGEIRFNLQVSPPNPIFLEPPAQVMRSFAETESGAEPALQPDNLPIQILLEFPDGHQREIRYTRLYVNDEVVAENTAAPFDRFEVPLDSYASSEQLRLRVEVEDELGLQQSSIETLVDLVVETPSRTWLQTVLSGRGVVVLVSLGVAALVLTAVIAFNSQRGVRVFARRRSTRRDDPVTQPVAARDGGRKRVSAAVNTPTMRKVAPPVNAPARLVRLSDDGNPLPQRVIPLIRRETTLGSDPQQAVCVIDSASVSPLHARIFQSETGQFYVVDAGSIAGTWLNFDPVNETSTKLEHSDIIHIGLMAFRFEVSQPTSVRKLKVTPYRTD